MRQLLRTRWICSKLGSLAVRAPPAPRGFSVAHSSSRLTSGVLLVNSPIRGSLPLTWNGTQREPQRRLKIAYFDRLPRGDDGTSQPGGIERHSPCAVGSYSVRRGSPAKPHVSQLKDRAMRIAMVGSGYVGLVSGACLAQFGHDVICIDKVADKIARLRKGEIPIYEPGLDKLVVDNVQRRPAHLRHKSCRGGGQRRRGVHCGRHAYPAR